MFISHPVFYRISRLLITGGYVMLFSLFIVTPFVVSAQDVGDPSQAGFQLVPCDGITVKCDYNKFILGIQRIIKACIFFAVPIVGGMIAWSGMRIMLAGGDVKAREEGKVMIWKVLRGFLLMLAAWYLVDLVLSGLLDSEFKSGLQ